MIELKPLTVSEYFNLEDKRQYDFTMKYAFQFTDPVDEYHIGDVMELPFGFIKDIQFDIEHGMTSEKLVEYVLQVTKLKTLKDEPLDKFCRFYNYLLEGVINIIKVESETLAYEASDIENSAGMDRFKDLGVYLQIRSLTDGDVTKIDAVRALPYSTCFTEMFTAKQLKDYEQELIKARK